MKKLIIALLVLSLCLGVSGIAFADEALVTSPGLLISPAPPVHAEYYATGKIDIGDLPFSSTRTVVLDDEGGMWVGTYGGGLAYKPADSDVFTEYFLTAEIYADASDEQKALLSERFFLGSEFVQALAFDDKGGMWISQANTYDSRFATKNKGVAYVYEDEITFYNSIEAPGTVPHDYVQQIAIAENGVVWFGSFAGLTSFNPETGEWKTYTDADGLPTASINSIAFDSKGNVWFGCYPGGGGTKESPYVGGFGYVNPEGEIAFAKTLVADFSEEYQTSLLADVWVRDIEVDANDGVWIVLSGTYGYMANKGAIVYYIDADGTEFVSTGLELLGDKLTGNSEIRSMEIDESGTIWFGTWNGVYAYDPKGIDNRCFSAANGDWQAPESMHAELDNIYSLDVYDGKLYIGSNGGVVVQGIDVAAPVDKSEGIWLNVANEMSGQFAVVDGAAQLLDVPPTVIDGRTFVPTRFVAENLGMQVDYAAGEIKITSEEWDIVLEIGSAEVLVNGEVETLSDAEIPFITEGRALVPLRFISEILGYAVNYDGVSKDISIK